MNQAHPVSTANTHDTVIEMLKAMLEPLPGEKRPKLRDVAKRLGLNPGYVSQVVRGKRTPSLKVYAALGIEPPSRMVEVLRGYDVAPVCSVCGVVHVSRSCPTKRAPKIRKWRDMNVVDVRRAMEGRR